MLFNPSRDQARQFLIDSWHKQQQQQQLTPLESMAVALIRQHPEYHDVLQQGVRYLDKDYTPEAGQVNPFLHLMMHLTLQEQLSINQPAGIVDYYKQLIEKYQSEHEAQHAMMECLSEMIMQAQRHGTAPDVQVYFHCLKQAGGGTVT